MKIYSEQFEFCFKRFFKTLASGFPFQLHARAAIVSYLLPFQAFSRLSHWHRSPLITVLPVSVFVVLKNYVEEYVNGRGAKNAREGVRRQTVSLNSPLWVGWAHSSHRFSLFGATFVTPDPAGMWWEGSALGGLPSSTAGHPAGSKALWSSPLGTAKSSIC